MAIDDKGRVGIGIDPSKEECESVKFAVNGYIRAKGLLRYGNKNKSWPDYVFDKNYNLLSLTKLENYINTHKHLPHIPSAKIMNNESQATDLYEVIEGLTKTIEEQALYIININKRLKQLEKINNND
ncbi:MAG: hypothetical protein ACQPRJ_05620 [Solitalea-like symbiont of Acarus siro]